MNAASYLRVWEGDSHYLCEVQEEPRVDAAVERWISSGRTNDTLLRLTMIDGDEVAILASRVTSWMVSTPEGRRRAIEWDAVYRSEREAMKQEAGIWDEADE